MTKLMVYIAFIICCGPQNGKKYEPKHDGQTHEQGHIILVADAVVIEDNKSYKPYDDSELTVTSQIEQSTMMNCDRIRNERLPALEKNPMLFIRNTFDLIK
ncbi:putative yippee-like protein [Dirofilaria immitis]|nr:hypothetical protein [Dirofilaria immitis]MCP9262785.1 hypothetical protein [Dirofilaria immitis]